MSRTWGLREGKLDPTQLPVALQPRGFPKSQSDQGQQLAKLRPAPGPGARAGVGEGEGRERPHSPGGGDNAAGRQKVARTSRRTEPGRPARGAAGQGDGLPGPSSIRKQRCRDEDEAAPPPASLPQHFLRGPMDSALNSHERAGGGGLFPLPFSRWEEGGRDHAAGKRRERGWPSAACSLRPCSTPRPLAASVSPPHTDSERLLGQRSPDLHAQHPKAQGGQE